MMVVTCGTAPREACREVPSPFGGKCVLARGNSKMRKDPAVDVELFREKDREVRDGTLIASKMRRRPGGSE